MALYLTAPGHFVNQCWFIINEARWHLAEGNIGGAALDIAHYKEFTNHMFENTATSPMGKMCWTDPSDLCDAASILNSLRPSDAYMRW